jgi:hypothetical protein
MVQSTPVTDSKTGELKKRESKREEKSVMMNSDNYLIKAGKDNKETTEPMS